MTNAVATTKAKQKFSLAIQGEGYKKMINNTLGDPKKSERFIASITSAVAVNPALQECEASTILSSALLGESLNLSPSPQLGQYYMVPFKKKDKQGNVLAVNATFVLGWKGYLQLAIRSGYYKKINVIAVKSGELVNYNPLEEEIEVRLIEDDEERENAETIGYYAMFEYLNGFKKTLYWSKSKMEKHADKYSSAFSLDAYKQLQEGKIAQKDMWKYSSFWYQDFDSMAFKTMIRQLISKWGIMSIDLQTAFEADIESDKSIKAEYMDTEQYVEQEIEENANKTTVAFDDIPEAENAQQDKPVQNSSKAANNIKGQQSITDIDPGF